MDENDDHMSSLLMKHYYEMLTFVNESGPEAFYSTASFMRLFELVFRSFDFNLMFSEMYRFDEDEMYESKQIVANNVNNWLRNFNAAIVQPGTGHPSILLAINSKKGMGRYTLESSIVKKRSGSWDHLKQMLPVTLTSAYSRPIERKTERAPVGERREMYEGVYLTRHEIRLVEISKITEKLILRATQVPNWKYNLYSDEK